MCVAVWCSCRLVVCPWLNADFIDLTWSHYVSWGGSRNEVSLNVINCCTRVMVTTDMHVNAVCRHVVNSLQQRKLPDCYKLTAYSYSVLFSVSFCLSKLIYEQFADKCCTRSHHSIVVDANESHDDVQDSVHVETCISYWWSQEWYLPNYLT